MEQLIQIGEYLLITQPLGLLLRREFSYFFFNIRNITNPQGTATGVFYGGGYSYLFIYRQNRASVVLPPSPYTHLKIVVKTATVNGNKNRRILWKIPELPQPLSVRFWTSNNEAWETQGALTPLVELSSPWYMTRPPSMLKIMILISNSKRNLEICLCTSWRCESCTIRKYCSICSYQQIYSIRNLAYRRDFLCGGY